MIIRDTLTQDRTYYVRTDGNDNNDGLTNSASGAFLTIQKAVDTVCDTVDNMGYNVTIQVANGTYNDGIKLRNYVGRGSVTLKGDTSTPSNVVIAVTSLTGIYVVRSSTPWHIEGLKITTTSSGNSVHAVGSQITFKNIDFGSCAGTHIGVLEGSQVKATGDYSITGNASFHIYGIDGSFTAEGRTITLTGTPAFSCFAASDRSSMLRMSSLTFSGSATGVRYSVTENSIISTGGGGANYLPGSTAGATASGGQYT